MWEGHRGCWPRRLEPVTQGQGVGRSEEPRLPRAPKRLFARPQTRVEAEQMAPVDEEARKTDGGSKTGESPEPWQLR